MISCLNEEDEASNVIETPNFYQMKRSKCSGQQITLTRHKIAQNAEAAYRSKKPFKSANKIILSDSYVEEKDDDHISRLSVSLLLQQCGSIVIER